MKFDFVIGNPPYQEMTLGENENFAPPVYDKFMEAAYSVSEAVELIHPARFLFDAGSTSKEWNKKMLNDEHFKVLYYEENSKKIFPNLSNTIKGGIVISYYNNNKNYGAIEIYTPNEELNTILHKVKKSDSFTTFSEIVITRTAYRLTHKVHEDYPDAHKQLSEGHLYDMSSNIFQRLPQIFHDEKPDDDNEYIRIIGRENNSRTYKYVRKDYVRETKNLNKFKVVIPKASGNGTFGEIISNPFVDEPGNGSTETFLTIGAFERREEAQNALKYIYTKFSRALLGVLKRTQEITPEKWKYVPLQDFSNVSDIDWSKSIKEIDQQLYKKYHLTEEEIKFIETNVKEME